MFINSATPSFLAHDDNVDVLVYDNTNVNVKVSQVCIKRITVIDHVSLARKWVITPGKDTKTIRVMTQQ